MSDLIEQFYNQFRTGIRAEFNWDRFISESWPIEILKIENKSIFKNIKLPWFLGKRGFVSYNEPGAYPVTLSDIDEWYPLLPERMKHDIDIKRQELILDEKMLKLEIPAFALPENEFIAMDINHRLSALMTIEKGFSISMWVVNGPIEPNVLADLLFLTN